MAADLDFSNVTDHFELIYTDDDNYLSDIFIKAHNDGVICDNYNNTAWDYEVPVTYGNSTSNTDWSNHGSYYPCIAIIKVDDNCYFMTQPAWSNAPSLSLNYVYVGRFRYTDNTYLRPNFYAPLALSSFCIAGQFRDGDNNAFFLFNPGDSSVNGKWASFESNLESMQNNPQYMLKGMFHEIFQCFTGVPNGYTPPAESNAQITAQNLGKITIETNIPIFLIKSEEDFVACHEYYRTGDAQYKAYAWDGSSGAVVNPKNLFYHIKYRIESRDQYGQNPTYTAWTDKWIVWEETEENAIAAYLDTDEPLSFNVKGANNVACKVSEDGGFTWTEYATAPAEYLNCLWFQGPLADGSGYLRYSTRARNISIYRTEVEANNYIATGEGQQYSIDPEVTNPSADRDPDFGTKEVATTFPSSISMANNTRHVYYLSALQVAAFKAAIFADTVTMETIVEGTQFWASSHLDCVTDTAYYPVDLEALSNTAVSRSNIVMGGYVYQASSSHYEEAGYPGMLDCGSVAYNPVWNDIRDYEPYSQLFIYLPYAGGFHRLNIDKYIGTTVSIKYAIDIDSGKCTAFLLADGILRDYFDGNMAVHMRLSSPDFQQDQLATMQNVTQQIGALAGGVGKAASAAFASPSKNEVEEAPENGLDAVAEVGTRQTFAGLGSGIASASAIGLQMFNANQGGPEFSSGGISPTISQYAPQYPFMIIATRKSVRPEDELNLVGYPSGASGQVGAFSGYLKASAVKLAPMKATKPEQDAIIAALQNGIYL